MSRTKYSIDRSLLNDARQVLRSEILPQHKHRLTVEGGEYVRRPLFPEAGGDPAVLYLRQSLEVLKPEEDGPIRDDQLTDRPFVFLVGDTGSGKSLALSFCYTMAVEAFLQDARSPFPVFLNLDADLSSTLDVRAALDHIYGDLFTRCTEAGKEVVLFADGVDEVIRRESSFVNDLDQFLKQLRPSLKGFAIACRRDQYNHEWLRKPGFRGAAVYHTDYIPEEVYSEIRTPLGYSRLRYRHGVEDSRKQKSLKRCDVPSVLSVSCQSISTNLVPKVSARHLFRGHSRNRLDVERPGNPSAICRNAWQSTSRAMTVTTDLRQIVRWTLGTV